MLRKRGISRKRKTEETETESLMMGFVFLSNKRADGFVVNDLKCKCISRNKSVVPADDDELGFEIGIGSRRRISFQLLFYSL
jgi:hypothetical protein